MLPIVLLQVWSSRSTREASALCAGGQEQLTALPTTRHEPVGVEHEATAAAAAVSTRTGGGGEGAVVSETKNKKKSKYQTKNKGLQNV